MDIKTRKEQKFNKQEENCGRGKKSGAVCEKKINKQNGKHLCNSAVLFRVQSKHRQIFLINVLVMNNMGPPQVQALINN